MANCSTCGQQVPNGRLRVSDLMGVKMTNCKTCGQQVPDGRLRVSDGLYLTPAEHKVTLLLCNGYKNQQIADELHISDETVKRHLSNVFNKVGCDDRLNLVLWCIKRGVFVVEMEGQ